MARLYLFAEGTTEQTFADTVLKPHLAAFGVYMHRPALIAHARRRRRVHRGGGRNFDAMQNDIIRFLRQDSSGDVYFTTMIDLYALPAEFPGARQAARLRNLPYKRVESIEREWYDETDDHRFIPFIQLHEFEAYLFTDVSQFAFFFEKADSKITALQRVADESQSPELIDDGPHTAPSKRVIAQFPEYSKATVGPQMAERIGLEKIRSECPHFHRWLERLENLGSSATP